MLLDAYDTVVLLPATTRYEVPGGVTSTSTERRIIFSPEIPGRRIGEARPEWEVMMELAQKVRPEIVDKLHFDGTPAIRSEIARVVPFYEGIQHFKQVGDQLQYGGPHLCYNWNFPTSDGKAHFSQGMLPSIMELPEGMFFLTTRRGKQFNSMIQEKKDAITGAVREAILISKSDAEQLGLKDDDLVVLKNEFGEYRGRVYIVPILPGNLQVHWPEGNVLLDKNRRSPQAGIPDYNALVRLEKSTDV